MTRDQIPDGSVFRYASGGKIAWRAGPARRGQPIQIGDQVVLQERIPGPGDSEVTILWPALRLVP